MVIIYMICIKKAQPYSWHKKIFDKAKSLGLDYFSSPFDVKAVDFFEPLNVKMYKIALLK